MSLLGEDFKDMITLLDQKISACRDSIQKAMLRAERIMEIQKQFDEEVKNDHIMSEDPFLDERQMDYQLDK
mgnify:CR=1 FL=1